MSEHSWKIVATILATIVEVACVALVIMIVDSVAHEWTQRGRIFGLSDEYIVWIIATLIVAILCGCTCLLAMYHLWFREK